MVNEFHIARITLEARSPLMIAAGIDDPLYDVLLARDVNGLPILPATSIAGVLRHGFGEEDANVYFGFQIGDDGKASPLAFTDGLFHWGDNAPRDGIVFERKSVTDDEIASIGLRHGVVTRDHIRLNDKGVVDSHGKFERSAAPAGSRFTFEITERGGGSAIKAVIKQIEQGLWLGGATRSGYGEMACIGVGIETVDLKNNRDRYYELARQTLKTRDVKMTNVPPSPVTHWQFSGQIEGPLLIGAASGSNKIDRSYYKEMRIIWEKGRGATKTVALIPASAIKGALRHRTLFHLRRLKHDAPQNALERIFGQANEGKTGQAGSLRFSDIVVENETPFTMTHVGIDRFTGGSRSGVLFTDKALWQPELSFRIEPLRKFSCGICQKAFETALDDLAAGRLGIGADWGDGVGVFATLTIPSDLREART